MTRRLVAAAACLAILLSQVQTTFAAEEPVRTKTLLEMITRDAGYPVPPVLAKSPYSELISQYAKTYGVPVDLAHAVVRIESNFNPKARGSAGEVGLMQIKPATARSIGYKGSTQALYDPETNIRYGMKYLAMAHELGGGETCGTILRYNAGHGAKRMNPISKRYCGKVIAIIGQS